MIPTVLLGQNLASKQLPLLKNLDKHWMHCVESFPTKHFPIIQLLSQFTQTLSLLGTYLLFIY